MLTYHTKNTEISRIFNDLFSFELPDEAWSELFTNNPVTLPVGISKAIIPTKIVKRIRTAIGIHILLPVATDTPGDELSKLLCYKQILDLCQLYVGYNSLGRERHTCLTDKNTFQNFLMQICNKNIYEGMFVEVAIQGITFPLDLSQCNFLEWTNDNMRTDGSIPPRVILAPVAPAPVIAAPVVQPLTAAAITAAVSAALSSCSLYDGPLSQLNCRGPYFAYLTAYWKIFSRPLHPCSCLFYG